MSNTIDKYKKRRDERIKARMDADDGRWVTTEKKHKVHISGEGVPDKGNPNVLRVMSPGGRGSGRNFNRGSNRNSDRFTGADYVGFLKSKGMKPKRESSIGEKYKEAEKEYGYGSGDDRIEKKSSKNTGVVGTSGKSVFGEKGEANISKFSGMSKEDRNRALDEAPEGSKILGVVVKNGPYKGSEVTIEKRSGYGMPFTSIAGTTEKHYENYWTIEGEKDPTIKATIRQILDGSNKYYELKK